MDFITELWQIITEMAPYLLFGFLVAGILSVVIRPESIERHLGGKGFWPVFKASIFGVPLPLCSCGVIPVSASLKRHGASRGAFVGFLISTPQTGVDSIMVTLSLLGPVFAVFRPVFALASGVIGGLVVGTGAPDRETEAGTAASCTAPCCRKEEKNRIVQILQYGFVILPRDIGKSLILGLLIAAVISVLIPDDYFSGYLGSGLPGMIVMMLIGIPVYVCATASIPVAAVLVAKGISPGAALVFLMTGPATNAANLTMIYRLTSRKTLIKYLLTISLSALAFGLFFDYVLGVELDIVSKKMSHFMPHIVGHVSAVVLILLLLYAVVFAAHTHDHDDAEHAHEQEEKDRIRLRISGMRCSQCSYNLRQSLLENENVEGVEVELDTGEAVIRGNNLDIETLIRIIRDLGYDAEPAETDEHKPH